MARIELRGPLGPERSARLERQLDPLTERLRPRLTVDLRDVTDLHPSVVSVLIRHQQRSARQGGELLVITPRSGEARHVIEQIGLCRTTTHLAA